MDAHLVWIVWMRIYARTYVWWPAGTSTGQSKFITHKREQHFAFRFMHLQTEVVAPNTGPPVMRILNTLTYHTISLTQIIRVACVVVTFVLSLLAAHVTVFRCVGVACGSFRPANCENQHFAYLSLEY